MSRIQQKQCTHASILESWTVISNLLTINKTLQNLGFTLDITQCSKKNHLLKIFVELTTKNNIMQRFNGTTRNTFANTLRSSASSAGFLCCRILWCILGKQLIFKDIKGRNREKLRLISHLLEAQSTYIRKVSTIWSI